MDRASSQPSYRSASVRRWATRLWRDAILQRGQPIATPPARPTPSDWADDRITAAWLGHATVLINFFGLTILTDPALFPGIGIRVPGITLGPRRLIAPALNFNELPKINLVLVSHAHFDHHDLQTLRLFDSSTQVVTAGRTRDLFPEKRWHDLSELRWGESKTLTSRNRSAKITAIPVKHWGARLHYDDYRGYNGYLIEREGRRIIFSGDTAFSESFAAVRDRRGIDLAIMGIGCYNPWIRTHCSPEQAVSMANDAAARFIMPVHHQTFRLSFEPPREPLERFETALAREPDRIALREIGETFLLPQ